MPPRMGLIQEVVTALWQLIEDNTGFATEHISTTFRRDRRIGSHERRLIAEAVFGMMKNRRRIEHVLTTESRHFANPMARALGVYVTWQLLESQLEVHRAAELVPGVDWPRVITNNKRIDHIDNPVQRLAVKFSLPDWLAARFLNQYPSEAESLAGSLADRAPLTIRTNTLRVSRDELARHLADQGIETSPTKYAPHGLRLASHVNVFGLEAFKEGLFEVQDEASQLVTHLVAPPPHSTVVDACAGAGGKTLGLAAAMANKGRLWALDISPKKLEELGKRSRRAGVSNLRTIKIPHTTYPPEVEELFGRMKRVLVDVPCSGVGAMRRNPETRWRLTEADAARFPSLQTEIALRALKLVAPGGRLIYSTCTVLAEENENVVGSILSTDDSLEVVRPAEIWGAEVADPITTPDGRFLKLLPHRHDTDGFFACVLRKRDK